MPTATLIPADTATTVPTATAVPTATPVPADTATVVPTDTAVPTATPMPADTATVVPTATPVPADTATSVPTATVAPADTATAVPTATAVATATDVPTSTPMPTDPAGPAPESVVQETDPVTGEVNDPRLAGLVFKTKVRAEANPGDRNEVQTITLGGVAIFEIAFENNTSNPLYGVVIRIVIPPNTAFSQAGSGLPLLVQAAGTHDEGEPPPFQQVVATINQNRGTEWELADLSGPCPEGAPAGTECLFRLGTVQPGESGELALPVTVSEDAPVDTRFELDTTLAAANLDAGLLVAIIDEATVETVAVVSDTPTSLGQNDEPLWRKLFLPLISR